MKWYGEVGFINQSENINGIVNDTPQTRNYYGDIIKITKQDDSRSQINLNFTVRNRISILADPYLINNFHLMAYVTFMGTKWRVNGVEVQYPRLIIDLGDVYKDEVEEEGE